MLSALFVLLPILFGLMLVISSIWEYMSWKERFTNWTGGMATSLGPVKEHGDVGPRLAYEYVVDGISYKGRSSYMKDRLPPTGEDIRIYYDPADPQESEWYDGGMHRFFMFGVGLIGLFIIWLAV